MKFLFLLIFDAIFLVIEIKCREKTQNYKNA